MTSRSHNISALDNQPPPSRAEWSPLDMPKWWNTTNKCPEIGDLPEDVGVRHMTMLYDRAKDISARKPIAQLFCGPIGACALCDWDRATGLRYMVDLHDELWLRKLDRERENLVNLQAEISRLRKRIPKRRKKRK